MFVFLKFWQLPPRKQILYIEVTLWLALARVALLTLPFRYVARIIGKHMQTLDMEYDLITMRTVVDVVRAINTMSNHLPWQCKCLVQAICAKIVLQRKQIQTTLFLGLAKNDIDNLVAHAWLRAGSQVVLGGPVDRYTVVSAFT